MSWKLKYLIPGAVALFFAAAVGMFFVDNLAWTHGANVDLNVYKPYVPNTEIDFKKSGNSDKYIDMKNGWGGQEPKWRCIVGDNAEMKLYVKDGKDTQLVLRIMGFGVFDKETEQFQKITVYANDTEIETWNVAGNDYYTAKIPAAVMTDNTLVVRLAVDKPFVSNFDSRPLGMAVKEIMVGKNFANKTKIKIGKWLKNQLKDIEAPDYQDTDKDQK